MSLEKDLKKYKSELKKLTKEIHNYQQNIHHNKKTMASTDNKKQWLNCESNLRFYEEKEKDAKIKRVDLEYRIKDTERLIEDLQYKKQILFPFYKALLEKLSSVIDGLKVLIDTGKLVDIDLMNSLNKFLLKSTDVHKEDMDIMDGYSILSWLARWRNVVSKISDIEVRRTTRGDPLARSMKAGTVDIWSKQLISELQSVSFRIVGKLDKPSIWNKVKDVLSNEK